MHIYLEAWPKTLKKLHSQCTYKDEYATQLITNVHTWGVCLFVWFDAFIGPDKEIHLPKNLIIFLTINSNMCFGCS